MNDNWWAVGETVRSRQQEIHSRLRTAFLRSSRAGRRSLEGAAERRPGGRLAAWQRAGGALALCC